MSNSETITIEKLAAAISKEVYIDIAKWHLYLNDAKLDIHLAEKFYETITRSGKSVDQKTITEVLNSISVKLGGGQKELPLSDLIPTAIQSRLLDVVEQFSKSF